MAAAVKAGLLLGAVLLIGGGVAARFVAPLLAQEHAAFRQRLRTGLIVGLMLLAVFSALDLILTIFNALGRVEPDLLWQYALNTQHGRATLLRYGLLAALAWFLLRNVGRDSQNRAARASLNLFLTSLAVALLATISVSSHAAAMGGATPLLADLAHFAAACAWAGPLFYLAVSPTWGASEQQPLQTALVRLSSVGLLSVLLLFASGIYSTLLHLQDPEAFVASPYGRALGVKLVFVLLTLALAGLNRLWLLPRFTGGGGGLRSALRAELLVLIAIFLATGILSTSPLPHSNDSPAALVNLQSFWTYLLAR